MLLSSRSRFRRWPPSGAAAVVRASHVLLVLLAGATAITAMTGCATFGRRGSVPEKVAACRETSRQAVTAMELGRWNEAETLLRQALKASPDDAVAHRHLADALWHRGATSEALSHISAAIRHDPNDARLAVRAGEMLLAAGDRDAALAHAEQAIRLDPKFAAAWALRGRVFWQLNQSDRAIADLQRALDLAPGSSDVLLDLAVMYRHRRQLERCLTTLHHLHDACPTGDEPRLALVLEGQTLLELGRPHQAVECLLAAVSRSPPTAEQLYYLAQAHSASGHYAEATQAAQQALAIDASHAPSRQLLAQLADRTAPAEPLRR